MDKLTYIFPIAVVAFLVLIFSDYVPLLRHPIPVPEPDSRRWNRRDSLCAAVLTVCYAVVAFLGLGNTTGVQRFFRFDDWGAFTVIRLPEAASVGSLRYYSGLGMGNYYVQFSADGEDFTDVGIMKQGHADLFKWNDWEPENYDGSPITALRLVADHELWLGELAVYDPAGEQIPVSALDYDPGAAALFDEQALIPPKYDYMNSTYFDEIYHARTAYEHIQNVYPYEISHPPLGKLILGLGIRIFGMTPFGWRFSGTLVGVLMLPALYYFLKKLVGGTLVPACCTAVFAFDFMHFVQTRIATIDSYAVFFILLMYLFFWRYLQSPRRRLRDWLPPFLLSGLCFGLGAASKWICIYAGGGLAVLWLIDRVRRWRSFDANAAAADEADAAPPLLEAAENVLWAFLCFVLAPVVVYVLSYIPYGLAQGMTVGEMLSPARGGDFLKLVWDNQTYMFNYHSGVTAEHPYSSVWWQWVLDIRPILYYLQYPSEGIHISFAAWVNPMLCWGGLLAMLCMVWQVIRWRDKTALFILVGYLAQLLPWTLVTRVVFEYHYFPSTVFLVLALAHVFRTLELRNPRAGRAILAFTGVALGLFLLFYPALRGLPISGSFGRSFLKWLPSWPL